MDINKHSVGMILKHYILPLWNIFYIWVMQIRSWFQLGDEPQDTRAKSTIFHQAS